MAVLAKDFAKSFYNSKGWKSTRKSYIDSVFGLCETCRKPGHIVHHKKHITLVTIDDPYITLSHDNLMYLCLECHNSQHAGQQSIREDVMFTVDGQLIEKQSNKIK